MDFRLSKESPIRFDFCMNIYINLPGFMKIGGQYTYNYSKIKQCAVNTQILEGLKFAKSKNC